MSVSLGELAAASGIAAILEHLAANPARGIARTPGKTPFDAVYKWVG